MRGRNRRDRFETECPEEWTREERDDVFDREPVAEESNCGVEERGEERAGADVGEEALEGGENEVLLLGGEVEEREEHAGEQRVADHLVQVAGTQQREDALRERYLRGTAAGARLERL